MGRAARRASPSAHDSIYITTYTITPEDLADADNRLYSTALSPADGLKYAAKVLKADGALDGKKIGVVMADAPGEPEIVESGSARHAATSSASSRRASMRSAATAGTTATQGVIESVRGHDLRRAST